MISLARTKLHLQGTEIPPGPHERLDLSHLKGFKSRWKGVEMSECLLDLAELSGAEFEDCTFTRCEMRLSALGPSKYTRCRFELCDLASSSFQGAWMTDCTFGDCRMPFASFHDAQLTRVKFDHCNLRHADLLFMHSDGVDFDESTLWGAKVSLDCHFFRCRFDEKWRRRFASLLAWAWPKEEPERLWLVTAGGKQYGAVERLMTEGVKDE